MVAVNFDSSTQTKFVGFVTLFLPCCEVVQLPNYGPVLPLVGNFNPTLFICNVLVHSHSYLIIYVSILYFLSHGPPCCLGSSPAEFPYTGSKRVLSDSMYVGSTAVLPLVVEASSLDHSGGFWNPR